MIASFHHFNLDGGLLLQRGIWTTHSYTLYANHLKEEISNKMGSQRETIDLYKASVTYGRRWIFLLPWFFFIGIGILFPLLSSRLGVPLNEINWPVLLFFFFIIPAFGLYYCQRFYLMIQNKKGEKMGIYPPSASPKKLYAFGKRIEKVIKNLGKK